MNQPDSDPTPPRAPRTRLEDEVLEILHRAERPPSLADRVQREAWRYRGRLARRSVPLRAPRALGPGAFLLGSLLVAAVGALVHDAVPLLGFLAGLLSFALLVLLWVPRFGGGAGGKRWRGRDLDLSGRDPAWLEGMRDRFRRPPSR